MSCYRPFEVEPKLIRRYILIFVTMATTSLSAQQAGIVEPVAIESETLQEIITASDFFDLLSNRYKQIDDYQAEITITYPDAVMTGTLYHQRPDRLLIEFSDPEDQVISVDGVHLQIYIPYLNVVLDQPLRPHETPAAGMATSQGLELMKSRYSIAYLDSEDVIPIDEDSEEMVRKLKLEWKSIDEGFRELILSINDDLIIRRIDGITSGLEELRIDFMETVLNQNFAPRMFVWDSPPSANIIRNFIFEPGSEPVEE